MGDPELRTPALSMAGTFRTDSAFTIRGHGLFLRGQIATGSVQVGGTVAIPDPAGQRRHERITRVDRGQGCDAAGNIRSFVGLQLGALDPGEVSRVRALLVPGMELVVADPEPGYQLPAPGRPAGDTS